MALFVKLDVTWVDSRKIVLAPMAVRGCHATAMCIAKRTENDGWFPRVLLVREGADDALIDDLLARELLEAEGDQVRPFGWLSRNPSQAAIGAKRASKSEAGRRGNHTRHGHPGAFEDCTICQVVAGSDRTPSQTLAPPSPESESETESGSDRRCDPLVLIRSQERGSPDAPARALAGTGYGRAAKAAGTQREATGGAS